MLLFVLLAGSVLAATVAVLLFPLLSGRSSVAPSRNAVNAALYAEQLAELEADLRSGAISTREHENAVRELKARLVADAGESEAPQAARGGRGAAVAVGVIVPLLAVGVYLLVGSPQLLGPVPAADRAHELDQQQVEAMVERLAERLKSDPGNVEGWVLLGRSYSAFGRFREAADAYATAVKLRPDDAQLLADYADTLGMALGRKLEGEPEKLIARALQIDPRNLKALALAGTIAFERKDYKAAAGYWERMLPLVPPDSDDARSIQANVEEARSLAEGRIAKKADAFEPKDPTPPKTHVVALRGQVKLAPTVAAQAAPTDTVFIFARPAQGPPMPLAVLRKQVRDLPTEFALDDSMAMAAGASLSSTPKVIVGARVSKTGSPSAQSGDLQGLSAPVANDASGVTIVIDTVVR